MNNKETTFRAEATLPTRAHYVCCAVRVIIAFGLLIFLLAADRAHGNLTATVSPGYQFPLDGSVSPTYQLLNELATPTITITGTVGGGTNSGIAPNSISGINMLDSFPDGGTLGLPTGRATTGWNLANPRQLSVDTTNLPDGFSGLIGARTNDLSVYYDPAFFTVNTNSLGSPALSSANTGNPLYGWLTPLAHSFYDGNIAPGGISSGSITNYGLLASTLNTLQIFTNIFTISGGTATNTFTNLNTVIVGNTNGLGEVVQLGQGLIITNTPTQQVFTTNGVHYTNTVQVPTLSLAFGLPLEVNAGIWTNTTAITGGSHSWTGPATPLTVYISGGTPPYTNTWSIVATTTLGSGATVSSLALTATNGIQTQVAVTLNPISGASGTGLTYTLACQVLDASGQRASNSFAVYESFCIP